jgi:hypothetical protein
MSVCVRNRHSLPHCITHSLWVCVQVRDDRMRTLTDSLSDYGTLNPQCVTYSLIDKVIPTCTSPSHSLRHYLTTLLSPTLLGACFGRGRLSCSPLRSVWVCEWHDDAPINLQPKLTRTLYAYFVSYITLYELVDIHTLHSYSLTYSYTYLYLMISCVTNITILSLITG